MDLNLHNSFGFPFRAQPLAFIGLALRTVALSSVEAIKGMAVLAVRLLRVDVTARGGVSLGVFGRRDRVQVLVVNAGPISADVVHNMSIWDSAAAHPQGYPVSLPVRSAQMEDAIPVAVEASAPYKAIALLGTLTEKPLSFLCSSVHSRLLQTARMAPQVSSVGELS